MNIACLLNAGLSWRDTCYDSLVREACDLWRSCTTSFGREYFREPWSPNGKSFYLFFFFSYSWRYDISVCL